MSESESKAVVYKPPARPTITTPSIILYGNMQKGAPINWRTHLATSLASYPVAILDPTRDDWDNSWIESPTFPKFREQIEWEMDYANVADVIVFQFAPGTDAPVSLLELGLYVGSEMTRGKVVVCCLEGYTKRGNVQMVCERYGVEVVESLEGLVDVVVGRLRGL
ncbi:hypothetical protein K491DRAFT_717459 [Lophiostoma macrostomum CBS 122681]|uniref:Nucleoside 2-deoxyribosyltransferase domain-containing protein n=1 Tax=Lophiostoma macrostomum CBS 122681 TaxID=1314788 RepID=A0A6A6T2R9_9PLEO|nr:hypothetical protein K491DRAFT_717459 [Lophiostoma macrostomum CBS 122681]